MTLHEIGRIDLPPHPKDGGFDHAAIDRARSRLYVAHTSNDAVDVIDLRARRLKASISALKGVAGVWVSEDSGLLFTSNREEDTVSIFRLPEERELYRLPTGSAPNGMAFDPSRQTLLVAGVGNRETGAAPTATICDVRKGKRLQQFDLPGRTRWATFHAPTDSFYVNIADPPQIARIRAGDPEAPDAFIGIPAQGPHGLEQDPDGRTLYCACDDANLVSVDLAAGRANVIGQLAGRPDVLWLNARIGHLYVAIGEPGLVQVFRTHPFGPLASVPTALGAHTLTVDEATNEVHVFLPESHLDLVLSDDGD